MSNMLIFPYYVRLQNACKLLQSGFKLIFGSGFLNSFIHDNVLVLEELFAIEPSSGDADSSLKILGFSITVLYRQKNVIVKKTVATLLGVSLVD